MEKWLCPLFLIALTATTVGQNAQNELMPELRPFSWMLGEWELNSVWTSLAAHDSELIVCPRRKWLNVSASEDGGMTLKYEYTIRNKSDLFGRGEQIIHARHTDHIVAKQGRLLVTGVVETEQNGETKVKRFEMSRSVRFADQIIRGSESDSMVHVSFRTSIRATLFHTYANKSYRPFTPKNPAVN